MQVGSIPPSSTAQKMAIYQGFCECHEGVGFPLAGTSRMLTRGFAAEMQGALHPRPTTNRQVSVRDHMVRA